MAAYRAALTKHHDIGERNTKPGTIDALIVDYYRSDNFTKALSAETQRKRRAILERFRTLNGGNQAVGMRREHVVAQIKGRAPYAQRNWLKALRGLMLFAVAENYRGDDPTAGVKPVKLAVKSKGHMTWGKDQIAAYRNTHPLGSMARLAIELLLNVAARRGDAMVLGIQHVKGSNIEWRPGKTARSTGKILSIRILPELRAALDAMPPHNATLAFLLNDYGRPFASAEAFGNKFADWCKQAGIKPVMCADGRMRSYRAHGLRKAACTALAHAGCTGPEIMAVSGHSSLAQVQVYIDEFEQEQMAEAAITKLVKQRTSSG